MKGIVLAGGSGTRLYPVTNAITKQLIPVYDKPAIYYPISTLMLAGIREILIISTPRDLGMIESLLGDGSNFGVNFTYKIQPKPEGIAQAFLIGADFIKESSCCMILGDNFFYGNELPDLLATAREKKSGATVFGYRVAEPQHFGVVEFAKDGRPIRIIEKPKEHVSNWAVPGLYFYDKQVVRYVSEQKPSHRGELEITDLNRRYLEEGKLEVLKMGRGMAWLDMGTPDSLVTTTQFVQAIEKRQGLKIACLEEIAYLKKFIDRDQLAEAAKKAGSSDYGRYLKQVLTDDEKT